MHLIMEIKNEKNYNSNHNSESVQAVNRDHNLTVAGINDISRSFWDEINNEIAANDLPLWRLWR
ncbi:hypothetical protein DU508_03480 [Pedobacter chinensis]|uniref:Uncharacterized protein n=2 Tax=Pedobacter chinensis TaxID=2282421 RepID=A0A369PZG3_9SPHI|nr:hypothetical protein DU508_03480 [Pedobacter chinensis]